MGRTGWIVFFVVAGVFFAIACLAASGERPKTAATGGMHDFDVLPGHWKVKNRRLDRRLEGSHTWIEFDADNDIDALPGGLGNEEHYRTDHWKGFHAVGLNLYEADKQEWALYWIDNRNSPGELQKPVRGRFDGDTGNFFGDDTLAGKPIRVRHRWARIDHDHVHWEQAFSADNGRTWETNWTMDFTRKGIFQ